MIPGKIIDWNKKLQKRLIMDNFQLRSFQSRMKNIILSRNIDVSVDTQIPLTSGVRLQTLNYMVTVELGGQKMTAIVNTGSDLSWVRCQPCNRCSNQHDPIFRSSKSPSFKQFDAIHQPVDPYSLQLEIQDQFVGVTLRLALKAEFMKQFSGCPSAPSFKILDSCFNLSGYQEVEIPDIKMYFEGSAELNVDVTGVFYFVKTGASQVCLAIAGLSNDDEVGIIGNYQQKNHRVIYDTKGST
uniref:Peptidase A1 domain-containing protein n=1 Tax=Salix viminalis TaxID=40686 RepID=A0A6N2JWE2_SALVM